MGRSPRQSVTIRHVAAEAGVSLQTVSRVVNNEPNVRPQVRERVMEAVKKLGYVPSLAARRMGGSRSYLIQIGRADVRTPGTNSNLECRLLLDKKTHKRTKTPRNKLD